MGSAKCLACLRNGTHGSQSLPPLLLERGEGRGEESIFFRETRERTLNEQAEILLLPLASAQSFFRALSRVSRVTSEFGFNTPAPAPPPSPPPQTSAPSSPAPSTSPTLQARIPGSSGDNCSWPSAICSRVITSSNVETFFFANSSPCAAASNHHR